IGQARAWRHAAVMALTVGPVVYLTQALGLPHGYWMALTLTVVLRPFDDQTWRKAWQRILGTLLGVVLSLLLAATLPLWAIVIALGATMVLTIAYSAQGDYLRQVVFLNPAAVLLGSTASVGAAATERVIATVAGALLAGAVALLLAKYDQRANGAVEVS
ncbi:MAG: FUSC family protein, partial [Propionicimonas sp.]